MNFAGWISRGLLSAGLILALLPAVHGQSQPAEQAQSHPAAPVSTPQPPQVLFKNLFVAVQSAKVFPDSKTFADAVPKSSPKEILARFDAAKPVSREALQAFVAENFELPAQASGTELPAAERVTITRHIDLLWDQLTRSGSTAPRYSSLLPLPEPYVVPGGRFREMYYWDSYFSMLGLVEGGRQDLAEHMVRNFAYLIDTYGHVPNGTRNYYLSRSQPPLFYAMVGLLSPQDPAISYARYLPQLRREHAFWMQGEAGLQPGMAHRRVVAMADGWALWRLLEPDAADGLVASALREFGRIDILINNAGIMPTGLIEHEDPRSTERAVQINLVGVINGTREAIRRMKPRGRGHIVNMSSLTARVPGAGVATYSATKAGVLAFCESAALELAGTGIDITVVQPSLVRTELVSGIAGGDALFACGPEDVADRVVERLRRPRFQAFVPPAIGAAAFVNHAAPARVRHTLARLTKADRMIVELESAAHASYDERLRRTVFESRGGSTGGRGEE